MRFATSTSSSTGHYFESRLPEEATARREFEVQVRGARLRFTTGAGTFSRAELDVGSRLLLETVRLENSRHIGDLGCGWGALSCFCAALAPGAQVWGCDINGVAVALARENASSNQLGNAAFWCGNGLDAVASSVFDTVLCNPPIRAGNAVIEHLFNGAWRSLGSDGSLWVVIRTAQGAKSWQRRLASQFGACETRAIDGGFRILQCIKQ